MLRKLLLISRFYYSTMFFWCVAVSLALAYYAVVAHGPATIPWCMMGKAAIYPLFIYVWIWQRYSDQFFYYRNLGIRRRNLLGISCAIDFALCYVLLKLATLFYEPIL